MRARPGVPSCLATLLLACLLPVGMGSMMDSISGLGRQPYVLDEHPQCINTFIAISAQISELKLKALHHQPLQDAEVFSSVWYLVVAAMAVITTVSMASALSSQRALVECQQRFREREEALLMRCQGIQDQAYDLGRKLSRACSRPSSRQANSRPSSRQAVTSPSGRAPGVLSPSARCPLPVQGLPLATAPLVSPPGRVPTPPGPTSEPSANGFSRLVEASLNKDTGASSSDQGPSTALQAPAGFASSAAQDSAAKAPAAPGGAWPSPYVPGGPYDPTAQLPTTPDNSQATPGASHAGLAELSSGACSLHVAQGSPAAATPQQAQQQAQQQQQQQQWLPSPPAPGSTFSAPVPSGTMSAGGAGAAPFLTPPGYGGYHAADSMQAGGHHQQQPQQQQAPAYGQGTSLQADMQQAQAQLNSPAGHAWVTTSRGSGTPAAFSTEGGGGGGFTPLQQGSQQFASQLSGGHPLPDGPFTPASGSTTRSAGTNVHSIAGSCGGSVSRYHSRAAGASPPGSAASVASGRTGDSAGQGTPSKAKASTEQIMQALDFVDNLVAAQSTKRRAAQANLREKQRLHSCSPLKGTPGSSQAAPGMSPLAARASSSPTPSSAPPAAPGGSSSALRLSSMV